MTLQDTDMQSGPKVSKSVFADSQPEPTHDRASHTPNLSNHDEIERLVQEGKRARLEAESRSVARDRADRDELMRRYEPYRMARLLDEMAGFTGKDSYELMLNFAKFLATFRNQIGAERPAPMILGTGVWREFARYAVAEAWGDRKGWQESVAKHGAKLFDGVVPEDPDPSCPETFRVRLYNPGESFDYLRRAETNVWKDILSHYGIPFEGNETHAAPRFDTEIEKTAFAMGKDQPRLVNALKEQLGGVHSTTAKQLATAAKAVLGLEGRACSERLVKQALEQSNLASISGNYSADDAVVAIVDYCLHRSQRRRKSKSNVAQNKSNNGPARQGPGRA